VEMVLNQEFYLSCRGPWLNGASIKRFAECFAQKKAQAL